MGWGGKHVFMKNKHGPTDFWAARKVRQVASKSDGFGYKLFIHVYTQGRCRGATGTLKRFDEDRVIETSNAKRFY